MGSVRKRKHAYEEGAACSDRETPYGSVERSRGFMGYTAPEHMSFLVNGKSVAVSKIEETVYTGGRRQI